MRGVRVGAVVLTICAGVAACSSNGSTASTQSVIPASSRSVSFVVDGTTTHGTLDIPAHRQGQHLAAALLLAGSGPTDRDGNQPNANLTPNTLKLIAGVLHGQGIMTLRFDKYFSGQTGAGAFASNPGTIDLNAFIRQADGAYSFLLHQPQTDKSKMLVVGHSEGGFYAMLVADTASVHPAGLALIEPQDERILSLLKIQIDEQLSAAVRGGQLSLTEAKRQATLVSNAITAFRAGGHPSVAGILPSLAQTLASMLLSPENSHYTLTDDEISPVEAALKVASGTRVLVTDGTADTNIPIATIGPLVSALSQAGTTGPGLQKLPGVNHDLHLPGIGDNDPVLAPSVIAAIKSWAQPYSSTAS